jgi:hypothetical protein
VASIVVPNSAAIATERTNGARTAIGWIKYGMVTSLLSIQQMVVKSSYSRLFCFVANDEILKTWPFRLVANPVFAVASQVFNFSMVL